jgi:membrane dipeptidase
MLIVDSHLDLAWNALQWNRDLELDALTIRAQEQAPTARGNATGTVALPNLRQGRVCVCFATTLARCTGRPVPQVDYGSPAQAYAQGQGHIAYYRALERMGLVRILHTADELEAHVAAWRAWDAAPQGETPPVGMVLAMESADPILEPDDVGEWHAGGIRVIGPAHYGPGRYAGGTGTDQGLTPAGRSLLEEMAREGVMLDVTHLSDGAFWQAVDLYQGTVLASHNNCRALVSHQRQFDDDQLRAIIDRDGVVGAAMDVWMLQKGWRKGDSNLASGLAQVVDHIDHVCQLAGNSRHAAIGSDLDGGFGGEQSPHDLDTIADLQQVATILSGRGYGDDDVAAIMHGNWFRLLRRALG